MSEIKFREDERASTPATGRTAKFRLDKNNGKLMGVCAGIGNHFGVDTTLVRIGFVAGALLGFGSFLLIYLAIGLIAD